MKLTCPQLSQSVLQCPLPFACRVNSYLQKADWLFRQGLSCLKVSVKPNEGVITAPVNGYFMAAMLWWAGFGMSEFCYCPCFAQGAASQTTCVVFAAGSPSSHGWQHPWASSLLHNIPVSLWLSLHLCCDFYFETWLTWQWPCWCKKSFSCVPVVAWLRRQKLLWGSQTDCRWLGGYLHCQNFVNMSPKPALFFKQVFFPFTAQHITSQKILLSGRAVYDFLT